MDFGESYSDSSIDSVSDSGGLDSGFDSFDSGGLDSGFDSFDSGGLDTVGDGGLDDTGYVGMDSIELGDTDGLGGDSLELDNTYMINDGLNINEVDDYNFSDNMDFVPNDISEEMDTLDKIEDNPAEAITAEAEETLSYFENEPLDVGETESGEKDYNYETSPETYDDVNIETTGEKINADNPYQEEWEAFAEQYGEKSETDWDSLKDVPFAGDQANMDDVSYEDDGQLEKVKVLKISGGDSAVVHPDYENELYNLQQGEAELDFFYEDRFLNIEDRVNQMYADKAEGGEIDYDQLHSLRDEFEATQEEYYSEKTDLNQQKDFYQEKIEQQNSYEQEMYPEDNISGFDNFEATEDYTDTGSVENIDDSYNVEETELVDSYESMETSEEAEDTEPVDDYEIMETSEEVEDTEPVDDYEIMETSEEVEDTESEDDFEDIFDVDSTESADDSESIENIDGVDNIDNVDPTEPVEDTDELPKDYEGVSNWLKEVNPNFDEFDVDSPYSNNCGSCAFAVYNRLEGTDIKICATEINIPTNEAMEAATGLEMQASTPSDIEKMLLDQGDGAHAIIGVDRSEGPGHWFNAAVIEGKVYAIDGQSGQMYDWPPDYGDVVHWDVSVKKEM